MPAAGLFADKPAAIISIVKGAEAGLKILWFRHGTRNEDRFPKPVGQCGIEFAGIQRMSQLFSLPATIRKIVVAGSGIIGVGRTGPGMIAY